MSPEKQLENYTKAEDVNMEKMLGQGGVKFYEFKNTNGLTETKTHTALPIVIGKMPKFYELLDDIDVLNNDFKSKLEQIQKELTTLSDTDTEVVSTFNKKVRDLNRTHSTLLNNKKMEVALLCFERTEKTSLEELSSWVTADILDKIEYLALGLTVPPKV